VAVGDEADDGAGGGEAALVAAPAGRDARIAEMVASNAELVASNAELAATNAELTTSSRR
jgi:hypothetical protein